MVAALLTKLKSWHVGKGYGSAGENYCKVIGSWWEKVSRIAEKDAQI